MNTSQPTIRLDKYLANNGLASRRDIEKLLNHTNVQINGKRAKEPGLRINPDKDIITVAGKKLGHIQHLYFMLNKPKGVISTADDEKGRRTAVSLVHVTDRVYPVGRLDMDSTGLLLITNDGHLANRLTHPRYHIPKMYHVTIRGNVSENKLQKLRTGIKLEDGMTQPAEVDIFKQFPDETILKIILHEGKKRQIRRMCEAIFLPLRELKRVEMGPLVLGDLKSGQYRELSETEISSLKLLASKTDSIPAHEEKTI